MICREGLEQVILEVHSGLEFYEPFFASQKHVFEGTLTGQFQVLLSRISLKWASLKAPEPLFYYSRRKSNGTQRLYIKEKKCNCSVKKVKQLMCVCSRLFSVTFMCIGNLSVLSHRRRRCGSAPCSLEFPGFNSAADTRSAVSQFPVCLSVLNRSP